MSKAPSDIASAWVNEFQSGINAGDISQITKLFGVKGWWKDHFNISFDFNALKTVEIAPALVKFGIPDIQNLSVIRPDDAVDNGAFIQAFLNFETKSANGTGLLRLTESSPGAGDWKAFTLFTTIWEIKGHEELSFSRRPLGTLHGTKNERKNWADLRAESVNFDEEDPTVLIIGGGQNGLMISARLTVLGIKNLVVEKNERIGDSWRKRYHTLALHDPIFADHFPYLPYPASFPIYIPKDKLANWFEHYAEAMELNVWTSSTIAPNPIYNTATKKWAVDVIRDGAAPRSMNVSHMVLATGFSGEKRLPSFPRDEFEGTVVHSSEHKGAKGWGGKNAVVVGCCNSGHDISADFYENGSDITIVQRSSTYVMSSKHGIPGLLDGFYNEGGPPTADADIMLVSLPCDVLFDFHIPATAAIAQKDKVLLDGLTKAGFKLNRHPPGLFELYFRRGGGYYIDVGCSQLIIDGKVKIKQGSEIKKLTKTGVLFEDGVELPADIVVLATGYSSMRDTVRKVISPAVADAVGQNWGKDNQGEIPGVWRSSGVEGFFLQSGNFFQARCYSKYLALQIQMIELGLAPKEPHSVAWKTVGDSRF